MAKTIVLVAEDDPAIRKALEEKLTEAGYNLILAQNGQEALDLANKQHPDLLILDILMPVLHGLEMLEKIRDEEWGEDIPAIVLTNLDDSTLRHRADELKATYLLKASTKLEVLIQTIHNSLKNK
jgi:CheY-like chemotaxis protein